MFTFRLAERLGRTVAELEASMSNREFMQWLALGLADQVEADRQQMRSRRGK